MMKTVEYSPDTSAPLIKRDGINWITCVAFTIFHLGAIGAFFFFSWPAFITAVVLYWMSMSFGIGMGYHRLLTHRRLQSAQGDRIFSGDLRDDGAGRRPGVLGGHTSDPSSVLR